jgi:hypothetical protein
MGVNPLLRFPTTQLPTVNTRMTTSTNSEVLIRRATIDDAKGINSFLADSFSHSFSFYDYLLPKGQSNRELVFEYWHKKSASDE